ncbi:hypothetical protein AKJ09_07732 [Labilithrix luteola]|uniref:Uncharacterized protein n=1 Tax=Labilithrix luteola TaxID=1391654 RepID=A0A0K1Q5R2_9BACT|nr:hypothetical protein AKJ09_07732 [Labilithrix luteola]
MTARREPALGDVLLLVTGRPYLAFSAAGVLLEARFGGSD